MAIESTNSNLKTSLSTDDFVMVEDGESVSPSNATSKTTPTTPVAKSPSPDRDSFENLSQESSCSQFFSWVGDVCFSIWDWFCRACIPAWSADGKKVLAEMSDPLFLKNPSEGQGLEIIVVEHPSTSIVAAISFENKKQIPLAREKATSICWENLIREGYDLQHVRIHNFRLYSSKPQEPFKLISYCEICSQKQAVTEDYTSPSQFKLSQRSKQLLETKITHFSQRKKL